MSNTIGTAVVEIIPNFASFSGDVAKGINDAVSKAEARVDDVDIDAKVIGDDRAAQTVGKRLGKKFGESFERASDVSKRIGANLNDAGDSARNFGRRTRVASAGAAAGLFAAVREAQEMEKALREVNTLTGLTGREADKNFGILKEGIAELSTETGIAQAALVDGLYDALSRGVPQDNAFEFLNEAAKLSVAGVTDAQTAVQGMTTVLNAFNLDASESGRVSDELFVSMREGGQTLPELISGLSQVSNLAAKAGISFTEVSAAIATITKNGFESRKAATALRGAISSTLKPSTELKNAFEELNVSGFEELLRREGSVQAAFAAIASESDGTAESVLKLLPEIEGIGAFMSLVGESSATAAADLESVKNASGAAAAGFKEIEKSREFEIAMTEFNNAVIELGEEALPILTEVALAFAKFFKGFRSGNPDGSKFVVVALAITAVLSPMATAIGFVLQGIGALFTGFGKLIGVFKSGGRGAAIVRSAFTGVTAAVSGVVRGVLILGAIFGVTAGVIAAAVAAVIATIGLLIFKWDEFKIGVSIIADFVVEKMAALWDFTVKAFNAMVKAIGAAVSAIVRVVTAAVKKLVQVVSDGVRDVVALFRALPGRVVGAVSGFGERLRSTAASWMRSMRAGLSSGMASIREFFGNLIGNITSWLAAMPAAMLSLGKRVITSFWDGMKEVWEKVSGWLSGIADKIKDLKGPVAYDRTILQPAGRAVMQGFFSGLKEGFNPVERWLSGVAPNLSGFFSQGQVDDVWGVSVDAMLGDISAGGAAGKLAEILPPVPSPSTGLADTTRQANQLAKMFNLTVSSLFRSPAQNTAAKGAKNSLHMAGLAADFSGSFSNMDRLHKFLLPQLGKALVELLWQVADHFDHVHAGFRFAGRRQFGGRVSSGSPFLVGETGPEVFIPPSRGFVMSNDDARMVADFARRQTMMEGSGRGGNGAGAGVENVTFNVSTSDPLTAAMRMKRQLRDVVSGVRVR